MWINVLKVRELWIFLVDIRGKKFDRKRKRDYNKIVSAKTGLDTPPAVTLKRFF